MRLILLLMLAAALVGAPAAVAQDAPEQTAQESGVKRVGEKELDLLKGFYRKLSSGLKPKPKKVSAAKKQSAKLRKYLSSAEAKKAMQLASEDFELPDPLPAKMQKKKQELLAQMHTYRTVLRKWFDATRSMDVSCEEQADTLEVEDVALELTQIDDYCGLLYEKLRVADPPEYPDA